MMSSFTAEQRAAATAVRRRPFYSRTYSDDIEKIYWDMYEVAEILNVTEATIRYWLKRFGMEVRRSHGKARFRQFRACDVDRLKEIHRLLRVERYTIEGAKRKLQNG